MYQSALWILSTSGLEDPRFVYEPRSISSCLNVALECEQVILALIRKVFFAMRLDPIEMVYENYYYYFFTGGAIV